MRIKCTVCNITKAGIRAIYHKENCKDKDGDGSHSFDSPITVFVAREHHIKDKSYKEITKEGEDIIIKVIGIRYQLNDDNAKNLIDNSGDFRDNAKLSIDTKLGNHSITSKSTHLNEYNQESFDLQTYKKFLSFLKFQEMIDKYNTQ